MLKYLTAGESHGKALTAILDGFPAGIPLSVQAITAQLRRRQAGYGRGARMRIEDDAAEILSGVADGVTTGAPVSFILYNRDSAPKNPITAPRPGHADFAGCIKYGLIDARVIAERAGARETAMRVCVGAACRCLLDKLNIRIASRTVSIGGVTDGGAYSFDQIYSGADNSEVRCPDPKTSEAMKAEIDAAAASGDTAGGAAEVLIHGVKPGIGAHVQRDRKLEYGLMGELGAIQTVKCVGIGAGVRAAALRGSQIHDGITVADDGTYARTSNNAGGIEGGISNGEDIRIMVYCKPVPTLAAGLPTVNLARKTPVTAAYERSDVCVVPAVGVIAENIAAYVLLNTILETTGGDTLQEVAERYLKK